MKAPYHLKGIASIALLLVIVTGLLGLDGVDLFDWDEINFAETGREMLLSGDYLQPTINFQPFHEKPPLFTWMQVVSFKLWGIGAFGARFPNVLCGLISLLVLLWAPSISDRGIRPWWALFFGLSLLPIVYFRSGIIDPWFNLFILAGLWPALAARDAWWEHILGGLVLGLAVLTKGPAAGLIAGLCWLILLWLRREARLRRASQYFTTGLLALVPIGIWLYFLWQKDDGYFAREFLTYQWRLFVKEDAGHGGFFGYHFVVLLFGCFPAGIFGLPALLLRRQFNSDVDTGMRTLFWVVLILFSIVNTKIIHYSSLAYFPLAWFAARNLHAGYRSKDWVWVRKGSLVIWGIYGLVACALPLIAWKLPAILPQLNAPALHSRLSLPVAWPWYTLMPGVVVLIGLALLILNAKQLPRWQATFHLVMTGLFVTLAMVVFTPRIQQYSQGAMVSFFQEQAGNEVFYGTAYHKSYAHWFYGEVQPSVYLDGCQARQCRFHEAIARPLFFSSPLEKTAQVLREVPDAELLYQEGGFSFYRRPPNTE